MTLPANFGRGIGTPRFIDALKDSLTTKRVSVSNNNVGPLSVADGFGVANFIIWDTNPEDIFDEIGITINGGEIILPPGGEYLVSAKVYWTGNVAHAGKRGIILNGGEYFHVGAASDLALFQGGDLAGQAFPLLFIPDPGEVTMMVAQDSGGPLDATAELTLWRLRP